jgi:hypothetical protein
MSIEGPTAAMLKGAVDEEYENESRYLAKTMPP